MKKITLVTASLALFFASAAFASHQSIKLYVKNTGSQTFTFYFPAAVWVKNVRPGQTIKVRMPKNTSGTVYYSFASNKTGLVACNHETFTETGSFFGSYTKSSFGTGISCNYLPGVTPK